MGFQNWILGIEHFNIKLLVLGLLMVPDLAKTKVVVFIHYIDFFPTLAKGTRLVTCSVCSQRGGSDRTIEAGEDASKFCAQTLGRLPTIGHDSCDTCGSNFSAMATPGCPMCGMGAVRRSDAQRRGGFMSPF